MTQSLACNLKAQQKVFLLGQGLAASCCRAYPVKLESSDTYQTIVDQWNAEKQQLQQNIAVSSCGLCWKNESAGTTSHRLSYGNDAEQYNTEVAFSNACNQMCSYCSPKFSIEWQKNIVAHGNFINISRSALNNLQLPQPSNINVDDWMMAIQQDINCQPDNSVELALSGGEPLMQKDSLKQLLELNSTKIKRISINTNLNPPDNKFLKWILDHFPTDKLSFRISLDATLGFNHVPRAGFDSIKFKENLDLLQSRNINFVFFAVYSVLNFFDLPNYYKWINNHNFYLKHSRLNNPDCLDPQWIPAQFSQPILDQLQTAPDFLKSLSVQQKMIDLKLKEQYNYLTQYFDRTGTDTNTTNAEFNQYWTWLQGQYK